MNAQSPSFVGRVLKSWLIRIITVLFVGFAIYWLFSVQSDIDKIAYAMTPPDLPEYRELETVHLNPEGWGKHDDHWFHHASQGTATLPIPYDWLVALEEPKSSPWLIFLGEKNRFVEEYILRLGFIKGTKSAHNPDALPVGLAKTASINFPGVGRKITAVGFTCAACHTGQIVHDDTRYVIDGGPAMTDLGLLTSSLGAALGQTVLSSKLTVFDGRFRRFAERVLGSNYNVLTESRLREELTNTIGELSKSSDTILVTEGFSRLDALNRIGNQVFAAAMNNESNYAPIDAPVNFPHIWTTSWFDWVQYDGSIMGPLTRNTGEALGVKAYLNMTAGAGAANHNGKNQRFASSVPVKMLVEIEDWIGGTHPLKNGNKFNGLNGPEWPAAFPAINEDLANAGAVLYKNRCQGCHLPPVTSNDFWDSKHWYQIQYSDKGEIRQTQDAYLRVKILPLDVIGTDPAQASVLTNRTIDTTGLFLDTQLCTWPPELPYGWKPPYDPESADSPGAKPAMLTVVPVSDSATSSFAVALGGVVERTNKQWFFQNYVPKEQQGIYEGLRPNCLQAAQGYKARPLNGVWATAPFLHNGSVATVFDLLSPLSERPTLVELGNQTFDTQNVGIKQGKMIEKLNRETQKKTFQEMDDYVDGRFILDTRQPGNHNTGHLFDEKGTPGRIGPPLNETERLQLIEYIKTL